MRTWRLGHTLLAAALWLTPRPAAALVAEALRYLAQYQPGVDYTSSYDRVHVTYETAEAGAGPASGCVAVSGQPGRQTCGVDILGGGGSGFGVLLTQAFQRQGTFYIKPDVGFAAHYLAGRLDQAQQAQQAGAGLPLRQMSVNLAALVVKPELTLGVTPEKLPDLLLSLGPAAQVAVGRVEVNGRARDVGALTSSGSLIFGFAQLEIVPLRFGRGAFSLFESEDGTGDGRGSKLYPKTVDGMSNVRGAFSHTVSGGFFSFGAKLVFNWP